MIIFNGKIVTWGRPNCILDGFALRVVGPHIEALGDEDQLRSQYPLDELVNAKGQWIMPGQICAHTHFYSAFSRGLAIPGEPPSGFVEILQKLWWRLDKALTHEDVYYSALVSLVDAIKHGTTTLVDHHAAPNSIDGGLDDIAQAVMQAGVRGCLCYEVTDRDGKSKATAGIRENERFARRLAAQGDEEGHLAALFGLHAGLTLSDETLEAARQAAMAELGFHIHVAEGQADEYNSLYHHSLRIVDRLQGFGILGENSLVAHAVHVDAREMELLRDTGTWVSHQPRSNMNNAVGLTPCDEMLRFGIHMGLGNDGFTNNMWEEWKAAYLAPKLLSGDPRKMPADQIAEMGAYGNAALASRLFGRRLGEIAEGTEADLIFVDYHPFTPVTPESFPWHIVFGFDNARVTATMVGGRFLMKDGQLLTLDEERIAREAADRALGVWQRFSEQF